MEFPGTHRYLGQSWLFSKKYWHSTRRKAYVSSHDSLWYLAWSKVLVLVLRNNWRGHVNYKETYSTKSVCSWLPISKISRETRRRFCVFLCGEPRQFQLCIVTNSYQAYLFSKLRLEQYFASGRHPAIKPNMEALRFASSLAELRIILYPTLLQNIVVLGWS